ncbi:MAG: hypothetical protein A3J28_01660 [Acidobacteria bacterium RIFCSPLOWO2_12_FULL_60_22]|nr:MAG: hypothetical protein A3J28_01660 [Acidobacteria bacterium RIFCSPLOWO2_12_FULL_60_22]
MKHSASFGPFEPRIAKRLAQMRRQRFAERFWTKDPTLWKPEKEIGRAIQDRLGWLTVVEPMQRDCQALLAFAAEARQDGFTHALLLGMGGSSLCAEVCRQTFPVVPGFLKLHVLDSTDPAAVRAAEQKLPLEKTLFLVSTKSGTTTETLCFFRYFYERVRERKGERAGDNFLAITDPGGPLVALAFEKKFRRTFLNPSDIGGRFSVLSYFGLVPAALMGVDIRRLLERAARFLPHAASGMGSEENPAVELGAILGELCLQDRNKLTFFLSPPLAAFGCWVEQLVAESTGKEGKGLLPIDGEPPAKPDAYGQDRLFVHLKLESSPDTDIVRKLKALEQAGHPVLRIVLKDRLDLGTEFFRWEIATAVAGSILKVNPFDEPNVKESKNNTERLLRQFESQGKLDEAAPLARESGISLYGDAKTKAIWKRLAARAKRPPRIQDLLGAHCRQAKQGNYLALLAYLTPSPACGKWLQKLRAQLHAALGVATTAGYGPRYLHSTGQFHKGGPPAGVFVEITAQQKGDLAVPGCPYTFGLLKHAQALGDLEALQAKKRPILRLHLEGSPAAGLRKLAQWTKKAFPLRSASPRKKQ